MGDKSQEQPNAGDPGPVYFPPELLQEAAKRGVPPDVLLARLLDLMAVVKEEAKQLFADWEEWSKHEQFLFCAGGARERVWLEFPYLDDAPDGH